MSAAKKKPDFEEALKELEETADQIEQGKIGLEESIKKYEAGMALIRRCREILDQSELKIQKLQAESETPSAASPEGGDSHDPA